VAAKASEKQSHNRTFLQEFVNFVRREDPKVWPLIEALPATGTLGDATDWLGMTKKEFARMRARLGQLSKFFLSGETVPRQRKPYKKRFAKTKQSAALQFADRKPHKRCPVHEPACSDTIRPTQG